MKKNQAAAELSQQIHRRKEDLQFILGTEKHQLWMLTTEEVYSLKQPLSRIGAISSGRWASSLCKYFKHKKK